MNPPSNRAQRWERIRAKGPIHFVIVYGVLAWGIGTALLFSLFMSLIAGWDLTRLLLALLLFPLGGFIWGGVTWVVSERRHNRTTNRAVD